MTKDEKHSNFPLRKKMEELEALESYFNQPDFDLEQAIGKHQEAMKLAKEINEYLHGVESTLEQIDNSTFLR